jgi:hypothetical protein
MLISLGGAAKPRRGNAHAGGDAGALNDKLCEESGRLLPAPKQMCG